MNIRDSDVPNSKLIKLLINMSITLPFLITVICCVMVVWKLRTNTREQEQLARNAVAARIPMTSSQPVTSSSSRCRDYSRSASTSTSRLSGVSRENSHPQADTSPTKTHSALASLRDNTQDILKKLSLSLSPRGGVLNSPGYKKRPVDRNMSQVSDLDSSRRASITITIITIAFIICYGPYMVIWIYSLLVFELKLGNPLIDSNHPHYLFAYFISTNVLSTLNSSIFPLIYFVRIKGDRIQRFVKCIRGKVSLILEKSDTSYHKYVEIQHDNKV